MYKYSKYLCDDKVDFLKNYKSNMNGKSSLLRGDNENNLEEEGLGFDKLRDKLPEWIDVTKKELENNK